MGYNISEEELDALTDLIEELTLLKNVYGKRIKTLNNELQKYKNPTNKPRIIT
jgi:hypothetical protein